MISSTEPSFSFGDFGNTEASKKPFSFKTGVTTSSITFGSISLPIVSSTYGASSSTPVMKYEKPLGSTTNSYISKVETTGKIIQRLEQTFFEWEIPDFLQQDAKVIHSPQFSFSNFVWYINLYPKISDDYMSISLSKEDTADAIEENTPYLPKANTACAIEEITADAIEENTADAIEENTAAAAKQEDTAKTKQDSKDIIFNFAVKKLDGTLKWKELVKFYFGETINFGKNLCWKRQELIQQKTELLPSGVFTVAFSVQEGVQYSSPERIKCLESLSSNFRDLFLTKTLCDVTIKVKDAEFQAHECILIARSSLFATELKHAEKKSPNVISIDDCDPYAFGHFLQYLYTGEIEDISFKTAYGLYATADKYNVRELKSSCTSYMAGNLALDNVCDVLSLANQHDEAGLMSSAEDYFCCNYSKIVSTAEWEELLKTNYRLANKVLKKVVSKAEIV